MVAPLLISGALALAKEFLPDLVDSVIGDDSGAVAKRVVDMAIEVTGAENLDDAQAALRDNPELVAQLRTRGAELHVELERAYLADRQDARAYSLERRKAGGTDLRANLMIAGAVVTLLSCLGCLVFFRTEIPGEVVGIVSTIAGLAGACLRDAFQFEFGSSRGSKEKDDLIALGR